MSTAHTIAAEATTQLEAAKKKAKASGRTIPWRGVGSVEAIILAAMLAAQSPASLPAPAAGADKVTVEAIYAIYPRKDAPRAAKTAIERAAKRLTGREPDPMAYLLERTRLYATAVSLWPEDDRQFIPMPTTWFNQDRFDVNPREWERGGKSQAQAPKDYSKL